MSKKIKVRPGDVWLVGSNYGHANLTPAFVNGDNELIDLEPSGASWPLGEEYFSLLVERLVKGDGVPFTVKKMSLCESCRKSY